MNETFYCQKVDILRVVTKFFCYELFCNNSIVLIANKFVLLKYCLYS